MPELIAISFPDEILAGQAAAELERRSGDLSLAPDAIGVSSCERDGPSQLLTCRQPGSTAAWSRFWGELFDALVGDTETKGLDPDFRQRVRGSLVPGTSLVLFVIAPAGSGAAIDSISQFGGSVLRSSLDEDGLSGRGHEIALPN